MFCFRQHCKDQWYIKTNVVAYYKSLILLCFSAQPHNAFVVGVCWAVGYNNEKHKPPL